MTTFLTFTAADIIIYWFVLESGGARRCGIKCRAITQELFLHWPRWNSQLQWEQVCSEGLSLGGWGRESERLTCKRDVVLHMLGLIREDNEAAIQCSLGDRDKQGTGATCPACMEKSALTLGGLMVTAIVSAVCKFSWICDAFMAGAKANRDSWGLRSSADLKGEKGDRGAPGPPGTLNLIWHWHPEKEYMFNLKSNSTKYFDAYPSSLTCLKMYT